jgi:hypothetical protein
MGPLMTPTGDDPPRGRPSWIPLALAPLVWMAQGTAGWYLVGRACPAAAAPIGFTTARTLVAAITLVSLACTVAAAVSARRILRTAGTAAISASPAPGRPERARFLAMLLLLVGVTLTVGLVLAGLPAAFLHVCGEAR